MIVISMSGGLDSHAERMALAEDIKSGRLKINDCAKGMILKGDDALNVAEAISERREKIYIKNYHFDQHTLYAMFAAKTYYDRARLCMEVEE